MDLPRSARARAVRSLLHDTSVAPFRLRTASPVTPSECPARGAARVSPDQFLSGEGDTKDHRLRNAGSLQ